MAIKLGQLRNLAAVIEAGTVRKAAKTLNLSQSSVTKSIQQLEADLGAELLHRGARGVAPTEAGKALLVRAKLIEAELRHARNDIEAVQGGAGIGEIRVCASPMVAMALLPGPVICLPAHAFPCEPSHLGSHLFGRQILLERLGCASSPGR